MSLFDRDAVSAWVARVDDPSMEDVTIAYEVVTSEGVAVDRVTFIANAGRCVVDGANGRSGETEIVVRVPVDRVKSWLAGDPEAISAVRIADAESGESRPVPPFDSETIRRVPPTPCYKGLDFLARLELTGSPAGRTVATIEFRDGRLAAIEPGEPAEQPLVKATMSMRDWVRFRSGRTKLYELFANGAVVEAEPSLLMFIAGYLDFDEVHEAFTSDECPRVEAAAAIGAVVEEVGFLDALRDSFRADAE